MCIKINLKQTVLARLFFFVIYDVKILFMGVGLGVRDGLILLTLSWFALQPVQTLLGGSNIIFSSMLCHLKLGGTTSKLCSTDFQIVFLEIAP